MVKERNNNKLIWFYVISLIVIFCIVVFAYFIRFSFNFNTPIESWVNTASYFNGILTPPLLAITSILIFLTWQTSKKELEETKELLKIQSETQKFKDDLDIFSKRINELDKKFVSAISERDLIYILPRFLSALHNNNLVQDYYKKVIKQTYVGVPGVEQMTMEISKYIYNETFNTDDAIRGYLKLSITHNKQCLLKLLFENNEQKNHIANVMIGQILINSNVFKRRVSTLERLLDRIDGVSNTFSYIYLEELVLHFDIEIIYSLIDAGYLNVSESLDTALRNV